MRSMMMSVVVSLLTLSSALAAEVYKWVDEKGKVQYGDRPPLQRGVSRIKVAKAPPVPAQPARPPESKPPVAAVAPNAPAPASASAQTAEPSRPPQTSVGNSSYRAHRGTY